MTQLPGVSGDAGHDSITTHGRPPLSVQVENSCWSAGWPGWWRIRGRLAVRPSSGKTPVTLSPDSLGAIA